MIRNHTNHQFYGSAVPSYMHDNEGELWLLSANKMKRGMWVEQESQELCVAWYQYRLNECPANVLYEHLTQGKEEKEAREESVEEKDIIIVSKDIRLGRW